MKFIRGNTYSSMIKLLNPDIVSEDSKVIFLNNNEQIKTSDLISNLLQDE